MATVGAQTKSESEGVRFLEWMDAEDFELEVAVKREHGQWYAFMLQFDITGVGETRHEAITEAFELLFAYLRSYFDEGAPFSSTLRPVPFRLRARIEAETVVARALRRISVRIPLADESTYALPPGQLSKLAPC